MPNIRDLLPPLPWEERKPFGTPGSIFDEDFPPGVGLSEREAAERAQVLGQKRVRGRKPKWVASITGYGLTVEGDTEQEATESAKGYLRVPEVFVIRVERVRG